VEIIYANILQDGEGSISNGLELLSFTLQPIFIDVELHLIPNLELVINFVLVTTIFVLRLSLFQLFLDYQLYLLNPLDELVGFFFISLFT
jgi:hypothetical protein